MADALGVKRTTYANWEQKIEPDLTTIKSIAEILGVDFSQIIGTTPEVISYAYDARFDAFQALLAEVYAKAFDKSFAEASLHVKQIVDKAMQEPSGR